MYYDAKTCKIKINEYSLLATEANISLSTEVQPNYVQGTKGNIQYSPNGKSQNFNLRYYLTGADPLISYINEETRAITGWFGGLYFNTGYLTEYNLKVTPNSPIEVDANIIFLDKINGTFAPTAEKVDNVSYPILNASDVTITNVGINETISNISSLSYSYRHDVRPLYELCYDTGLSYIDPCAAIFGSQEVTVSLDTDNLDLDLTIMGKTGIGINVNFVQPGVGTVERLTCTGFLTEKNISTSVNQLVKKNITIYTATAEEKPFITSIDPAEGVLNSSFSLFGRHLSEVYKISFGNPYANVTNFTYKSDSEIRGVLTPYARSGLVTLHSAKGYSFNDFSYPIAYPDIEIYSFDPVSGDPRGQGGRIIRVTGNNFYQVNQAWIGDKLQGRVSSTPNLATFTLTTGTNTDKIYLLSTLWNKSGESPYKFVTPPIVTGFTPESGKAGDTITILGRNFSELQKVRFGSIDQSTYTLVDSTELTAALPAGPSLGTVRVYNVSGLYGESVNPFYPYARITGVNPTGAGPNVTISISGENFDTGIMYPTGTNQYVVSFNDIATGFYRVSDILLTGNAPTGEVNGPIQVWRSDSGRFASEYSFRFYGIPEVSQGKTATRGVGAILLTGKTNTLQIYGRYLDTVNTILFSGNNSSPISGSGFAISSQYLVTNNDGLSLSVTGYRLGNPPTGAYFYYDIHALSPYGTGILNSGAMVIKPRNQAAAYGSGSQSSNYFTSQLCRAYVALDGNQTGISGNYGISLTAVELNPWWEVDLQRTRMIDKIYVFNRQDTQANLLNNFHVYVLDSNRNVAFQSGVYTGVGDLRYPQYVEEINCPTTVSGQYVRIQLSGATATGLGLAEVEIY